MVDQWKNTDTVMNWFQSITDNSTCIFMQFDMQKCILFISKHLLMKAMNYAKEFVEISDEEFTNILHSRKSDNQQHRYMSKKVR